MDPEKQLFIQSCGTNFNKRILFNRWAREDYGVLDDVIPPLNPIMAKMTPEYFDVVGKLSIVVYFPPFPVDSNIEQGEHDMEMERMKNIWNNFMRDNDIGTFRYLTDKANLVSVLSTIDEERFKYTIICDYTTFLFVPNLARAIYKKSKNFFYTNWYLGYALNMKAVEGNLEQARYFNDNMIYAALKGGIVLNYMTRNILVRSGMLYNEIRTKRSDFNVGEIVGRILLMNDVELEYMHNEPNFVRNLRKVEGIETVPYGFYPVDYNTVISWINSPFTIPDNHVRKVEDPFWSYEPPLSFGDVMNNDDYRTKIGSIGIYGNSNLQKVPRIIHQIWIGDKEVPKEILDCKMKFEQCGWEYHIWDDNSISFLRSTSLFNTIGDIYYKKADIIRLELLYEFGGIVIDGDSICLRSMDVLLKDTYESGNELFASCEHEVIRPGLIATGIVGAVPKSLSMYFIMRALHLTNIEGVAWVSVGPYFVTKAIRAFDLPTNVLSSKLFFPLHHTEVKRTVKRYVKTRMYEMSKKHHSFTVQLWGSTFLFSEVMIKTPKRMQADGYLWHVGNEGEDEEQSKKLMMEYKMEKSKEMENKVTSLEMENEQGFVEEAPTDLEIGFSNEEEINEIEGIIDQEKDKDLFF